ncbi:penicillin-binding protein 1C [Aestuariibius insulae]|uniref:penicillin-binding protein 1C n=1 Tax=Aestuariibius insulae TaxID=2058287 RepID=UPI00345E9F23
MRRWIFSLAIALFAIAAVRDGLDRWIDATVLPPLEASSSVEVLDREGQLLRAYTMQDGRWRLPVRLEDVDSGYLEMLIRYEDKRFYAHQGVDPIAMLRSGVLALRHREITSGGSTLTMQVARLLEDGSTGRWEGKLRQIRVALALERVMSKDEILTLYLNHAPFGGNIEGVRAASRAYFDKPPKRLTVAQSALLVALPQSPEARRPDRAALSATHARDAVLSRLHDAGLLDESALAEGIRLPVDGVRHPFPTIAPHLSDRAIGEDTHAQKHHLTIDRDFQISLEALASQAVTGRSDRVQVAILAMDHQSGHVLGHVGSAAYRADGRSGFIDLAMAVRSPGSTLKPLTYGLGFDQGLIHPETLIADRPTDFDGYRPQNFDGRYRGELRVRKALQHSLNIPAVAVTHAMGPQHLTAGLRRAGADAVVPGGEPGLAVALGGVGLSLTDLVRLYGAIGNEGRAVDLRWRDEPTPGFIAHRVLKRASAWQISDILLDVPRPVGVRSAGIAYKTGTSYGHRDAWAIGFDGRHVVGVWMGRADGTPVPGAFGGDLAAPVLFAAFARLKPSVDPIAAAPPETLTVETSQLPQHLRRFDGSHHLRSSGPAISFPPNGAIVDGDFLIAKVEGGQAPYVWLADGRPVGRTHRNQFEIDQREEGFLSLTVIDAAGRTDGSRIQFR